MQPERNAGSEQDLLARTRACLEAGDVEGLKALLAEVPAADVAAILRDLDEESEAKVFRLLDASTGADVLDELAASDVQTLAEAAPRRLRDAIREMEPDEVADVLDVLPEEQAEQIIEAFPAEQASAAEQLRAYPPDTAGGLMTTEFVLLYKDITARKAIEITQRQRETETVAHLFVADENDRLVGRLPLQRLVFAPPDRLVSELMEENPYAVSPDTDQEELVRAATRYDLAAIPVVDDAGRLIGVVTVDDILEAAEQEVDEDLYRLAGITERDPVHANVFHSTRLRLPWLLLSVLDGLFIAFIMSRFTNALQVVQLAFFVPLIPLMGGQVAIQASTIVVRGMALGEIPGRQLARFMFRQLAITILLALACAAATGLLGLALVGAAGPVMLAVGLAILVAMCFAGSLGLVLPLVFQKLGIDPAVSSGPFVTMINDFFCVSVYLALGALVAAPRA